MKAQNKKQIMYENIQRHGDNLKAIFNIDMDSIELCKKLHRLEIKAERLTTEQCNSISDARRLETEKELNAILKKVSNILNDKNEIIFINHDPRGYALKIDFQFIHDNNLHIYTDLGSDGIVAPDFSN